MAMEINGLHYGSYGPQGAAGNGTVDGTKRKEPEKAQETAGNNRPRNEAGNNRPRNTAEYASELAKLVPSVEFKVGSTFASNKKGKTLTVDPRLLEKMQNDPEKEKEMKELIRGVESAVKMLESVNKASGWTVVYKHCYIDENGKFWSVALLRNDFMLNMSDELREERRKNAEKLIEKTKEKAVEKREDLEEMLEETREEKAAEAEKAAEKLEEKAAEAEKPEEKVENKAEEKREERAAERTTEEPAYSKAEQLVRDKMAESKDGMLYLDDADIQTIIEAVREDKAENAGKNSTKGQAQIGARLDIKI